MSELKRYAIVDEEGNIASDGYCYTAEEASKLTIVKEKDEKVKDVLEFKRFNMDKMGGFYFMTIFLNNKILFNEIPEIKDEDLIKLLYIGSYLDYFDRNGNKICKSISGNRKIPMSKAEVVNLLDFTDTRKARKWCERMETLGLLYIYDDYVEMNKDYFFKGKVEESKDFTRVYTDTIRKLYKYNQRRKDAQLGKIIRLLSFTNINTNIICSNPTFTNDKDVKYLDRYAIAELLGVGNDKRIVSKLVNNLLNFKVIYDGYLIQVFKLVKVIGSEREEKEYFVVNPMLAYRGTDYKTLEKVLKDYFFDEKDMIKL